MRLLLLIGTLMAVSYVSATPSGLRQKPGWNFNKFQVVEDRDPGEVVGNLAEHYNARPGVDPKFEVRGDSIGTVFELGDDDILRTLIVLDREQKAIYEVALIVIDLNTGDESDPLDFVIQVLDINDNSPVFTKNGQYQFRVREGAENGAKVGQVKATDKDAEGLYNYGLVRYSLLSGGDGKFTIDKVTGMITTVGKLDHEVRKVYNLQVKATDSNGNQGSKSTEASVEVSLIDINDNAPYFATIYDEATVKENAPLGHDIITVAAQDSDLGENSHVTYSLVESADSKMFSIATVRNKGVIRVKQTLDYEGGQRVYEVEVRVDNTKPLVNGAQPSTNNIMTVKITVENVNEAPEVPTANPVFRVKENAVEGQEIGKLTAEDPEGDPFSWTLGDSSGKFAIDSHSGVLSVVGGLDYEDVKRYDLKVVVGNLDEGLVTRVPVTVMVEDYNDNPAVPVEESKVLVLCQNSDEKYQILKPKLKASDIDTDAVNGVFTFYKTSDPTWTHNFRLINYNDGSASISTERSDFDVSNVEEYKLPYIISDGGNPARNATYYTTIRVCHCAEDGSSTCGAQAIAGVVGVGTPVVVIIVVVALLLCAVIIATALVVRRRRQAQEDLLIKESTRSEDLQSNFDDRIEGGGEEDNVRWSLPDLMNGVREARGEPQVIMQKAPIQMNAPPDAFPTAIDVEFVENSKQKADEDDCAIPNDSLQVYNYEGVGSYAGSLSSINSSSTDGDQDYDPLKEWGPKFEKLASIYGGSEEQD